MSDHSGYLQTQGDHVAFVRSICLAEPKYSLTSNTAHRMRLVHPEDNKAEGYVVSGSLAAFTASVTGRAKQDILDATLFAQMASDQVHDREGEIIEWYKFYNHILGNLGFVIEDVQFQRYQASGASFKMDEVVLEIIAAIATGDEMAVLTTSLNALRIKAQNANRIIVFDAHSNKYDLGNFQVNTCRQAPDGEVSLTMGAFNFKTNRKQVNFLFFEWQTETIEFETGVQTAVLNTEVYARVRSVIGYKLGSHAVSVVATIKI